MGVGRLAHADEVIEQIGMFDNLSSTVVLKPGEGSKRIYTRSREKQEKLETLMDELRGKYGQKSITLGYQENKDIGIVRGDGRR